MKRFSSILVVAAAAHAIDPDTLQVNRWYAVDPAWKFQPGLQGHYQPRSWCSLRFQSRRGTLIFYEGYTRTGDCIYANSLYEYNLLTDSIHMRSISHWECVDKTITELPANRLDPTPMPRHTYAQFAYSEPNDRLYLAHGASGSDNHQHDLWAFSFADSSWEYLGAAPGATEPWDLVFETNLIPHPPTGELYLFHKRGTYYAYNPAAKTWRTLLVRGATSGGIGVHGCYDSKRNRYAFYGNGWTANDAGSNQLTFFDPATNTWSDLAPSGNWPPPKSYSPIEYNAAWDVYMLQGGWQQSDTWIFDPNTSAWSRLSVPSLPAPGNRGTYAAYDPVHDVLVHFAQDKMWLLRYRGAGQGVRGKAKHMAPQIRAWHGTGRGIEFRIPEGREGRLWIRDSRGRRMADLGNSLGRKSMRWDAAGFPPGKFFLEFSSGSGTAGWSPFVLD